MLMYHFVIVVFLQFYYILCVLCHPSCSLHCVKVHLPSSPSLCRAGSRPHSQNQHITHAHFTQPKLEMANSTLQRSQLSVIRPLSSDCAAYLPREWSNDVH